MNRQWMSLAVVLVASGLARGSVIIYDNTVSSTDFGYLALGDIGGGNIGRVPSVDDLQVSGGGMLEQVTFAAIAETLGGAVDAHLVLAIDNGDGIPDYGPGSFGSDSVVLQKTVTGVNGPSGFIPTGSALLVNVDVAADGVVIPDNARVWAQVGFTRFGFEADVNQVFFGPVSVGSTDPLVYKAGALGIDGEALPDGDGFAGLGWRLSVVPEPWSAGLLVIGLVFLSRRRPA